MRTVVERILDESLDVRADENFLFFTDYNSPFEESMGGLVERRAFLHEFFEAFVSVGEMRGNGIGDKCESTRRHGGEPGSNIWRLAFGDSIYRRLVEEDMLWKLIAEVDLAKSENDWLAELLKRNEKDLVSCVVAFPWYSVTHTRFTRLLVEHGCRFASMPMLTQSVLDGPMQASWEEVAARTKTVYHVLAEAVRLSLTCPLGTSFSVSLGAKENIHQDTGLLQIPGSLGNLPAGEAYFVPAPESAEGKLVFTSGPDKPSVEPTEVIVNKGKVSFCENDTAYAKFLDSKFQADFRMRHVAELGIGTNPRARDVGSMIEGEKIQGTVHIALGDDITMGGSNQATEHWDHVMPGVTLSAELTDKRQVLIIEDGELLI